MSLKRPKILLIGAGKFGINYVRILKDLHEKGEVDLVGVCVSTEASAAKLKVKYNITTFTDYPTLLPELDAVFVVTPPATHFKIVSDCLPYVHVLSEKPLALHSSDVEKLDLLATQSKKILMTGQIFRFHALTSELVKLISGEFGAMSPKKLKAVFVNPNDTYINRPVAFEFIHWFDQVSYLFPSWQVKSIKSTSTNSGRVKNVFIQYENVNTSCNGDFVLGWGGEVKDRTFTIIYKEDTYVEADYISQTIKVCKAGEVSEIKVAHLNALAEEINLFLSVVKGEISNPVTSASVAVSVKIAEQI